MKKLILTLSIILGCLTLVKAQSSLNDYKYVIVEDQFHFQNEPNEYDLNELTRFLFKKHGFRPILDSDVYPKDLKSNYCLALTSEVITKGALITKITIVLKDCNNNILFTCEGKTKEKEFNKVYNIAIRKAFEHFDNINYKYIPNADIIAKGDRPNDEVEELKAEIKSLKTERSKLTQKADNVKEVEKLSMETKELKEKENPILVDTVEKSEGVKSYLIARLITNGFELVSSKSNKIEYTIYKTGMDNVFSIKGKGGIIYKKGNQWIMEYIDEDKTIKTPLEIKF